MPKIGLPAPASLLHWSSRALADLADLVWPRVCPLCDCDADGGRFGLCGQCLLDLEDLHHRPACPACGKPSATPLCPWCDGHGQGPIKRIIRLGEFTGPLRTLVHLAKYRGRWELASALGSLIAETRAARELLKGDDVVLVPVPLHPHRKAVRGYDQAHRIAAALGGRQGVPLVGALARTRATLPQTSLTSVAARRTNLRDAFALVGPEAIAGKHVVLVDDVATSGATLRAAARALQPAKPASLSAVVVGVADPRANQFESI